MNKELKELYKRRGKAISKAKMGHTTSLATREKIRATNLRKGIRPVTCERSPSLKTRRKQSLAKIGKRLSPATEFKKGENSYPHKMDNYHITEATRLKLSESHRKGFIESGAVRKSTLYRTIVNLFEYKQWRSKVFQRDNWICQTCWERGYRLAAHHIKSFSKILRENKITTIWEAQMCEELWDVNNGITLCRDCHKLTDNYGSKWNKGYLAKSKGGK